MNIAEKLAVPGGLFQQIRNIEEHIDEDTAVRVAALDLVIARCEEAKARMQTSSQAEIGGLAESLAAVEVRAEEEAAAAAAVADDPEVKDAHGGDQPAPEAPTPKAK